MKERNKKLLLHPDHKLITRRDFLAQGLLDTCALATVPSLLQMAMSAKAYGAECFSRSAQDANLIPMLIFDCVGGASISGNFLVGKEGGPHDYLSTYNEMGIPTHPLSGQAVDERFGLPMFTNLSKIREGILATASPEAMANLRMASICTACIDDTPVNSFSPLILASTFGARGSIVPAGVGMKNTRSGGYGKGTLEDPSIQPVLVNSVNYLLGAFSYGSNVDNLPTRQKAALAQALMKLHGEQAERFKKMSGGEQYMELVRCGYLKNAEFVDREAMLQATDPRRSADCRQIYGITETQNDTLTASPTIAYNVLKGNTGPGAIVIGGCDYHDGTQETGDAKDLEIGMEIGRAVELAKRLNRKLFFMLFSDGSVYSDPGTRVWRGDAGSKALQVMGFFDPNNVPTTRKIQLGNYREGQGVERKTYIGSDPKKSSYIAFANYLSVNGRLGEFERMVSAAKFDPKLLDQYIVFG